MAKKLPLEIRQNPRYVALELLTKVESQQAYSNVLLNDAIKRANLSEKDGRLLTEIVYGTISRKLRLAYYLEPFTKKAKKIDVWVQQLLLLSAYQLLYLDRVPAHAILNDAVEIAKQKGNVGIGKFVNGVLRNLQRYGAQELSRIKDPIERLAVEISMPKWLTLKLLDSMGIDELRELGNSLFQPSHVSARVNTALISKAEALAVLEKEGIEVVDSQVSPYGVVGKKGFLAGSSLFKSGQMTIQDESSMLVAPAMQIEPHHQVLDACAAPGGKTTHIATFLDASKGGKVTSLDIHERKIALIKENAERLHVADVVDAQVMDARKVAENFEEASFDRILVDAPCSGLGLLRRKPDIKYSKKPEDFLKLQGIQLEILESVATKVKVCGIITYSTCTIAQEENQEVIEQFLATHENFEKITVAGSETVPLSVDNQYVGIYPHHYQTDGFFICCLRRIS